MNAEVANNTLVSLCAKLSAKIRVVISNQAMYGPCAIRSILCTLSDHLIG